MPSFSYRAIDREGKVQKGTINTHDKKSLIKSLEERKLELISFTSKNNENRPLFSFALFKNYDKENLFFFKNLHDLLSVGYDLKECLSLFESLEISNRQQTEISTIISALNNGNSFSTALSSTSFSSNPTALALIKIGESSGKMPECLSQIITNTKRNISEKKRIISAIRYPLLLIILSLFTLGFMIENVIPEVASYLQTISSNLPPSTKNLIALSTFLSKYSLPTLGGLISVLILLQFLRTVSVKFSIAYDRFLLKIPFLGHGLELSILSSFSSSLSALLESGYDIRSALSTAISSLKNQYIISRLQTETKHLSEGKSFSTSIGKIYSPFHQRVLTLSEKSGNLTQTLSELSQILSMNATEKTDRLIATIEPLLTCIVGVILIWIVIAVLGPIYESLSTLNFG